MEWLIVRAAGRDLAIDVRRVREILAAAPVTSVPLAPRALRGIAPIRGQPVAVLDLAVRLGAHRAVSARRSPMVVVNVHVDGAAATVALLVEDAGRLVASSDVLPLPAQLERRADTDLCAGFVLVDGALVPVLDLDAAALPGSTMPSRFGMATATTTPAEDSAVHPERSADAEASARSRRAPTPTATATATPVSTSHRIPYAPSGPPIPEQTTSGPSAPTLRAPRNAPAPIRDDIAVATLAVPAPPAPAPARHLRPAHALAALTAALALLGGAAALLRGPSGAGAAGAPIGEAPARSSGLAAPAASPVVPVGLDRHDEARAVRAPAEGRLPAEPPAPPGAPAPALCEVHGVVGGDTLWALAARRLGDPRRWPEIYRANRDVLSDPDRIMPGERLRIPDHCEVTGSR